MDSYLEEEEVFAIVLITTMAAIILDPSSIHITVVDTSSKITEIWQEDLVSVKLQTILIAKQSTMYIVCDS